MAAFVSLFGEQLVSGTETVKTAEVLDGKVVGIYFSAHWCPPCRGFTPKLAEWYTKSLQAKVWSCCLCVCVCVCACACVRTHTAWGLLLPHSTMCNCSAVCVISQNVWYSHIATKGDPLEDPRQLLLQLDHRQRRAREHSLVPELDNFATKRLLNQMPQPHHRTTLQGMEVVFVSSDKNEEAFTDYFAEMPWKALPFVDRERKAALSNKFKVSGIPSFVILDKDGSAITTDGMLCVCCGHGLWLALLSSSTFIAQSQVAGFYQELVRCQRSLPRLIASV